MFANLFSKPPMIGLDISSTSVKLVELSHKKNVYRVEAYAVEPLPVNAVMEKKFNDVEAVAEAIRRCHQRSGTKSKHAAVAIAGSMMITKQISMPADLSEDEIEEQIMIEADQHIPYPIEDISLDFEVIGPHGKDDGLVDVLIAAARTEHVDDRKDAVISAGLKAEVVDAEPFTVEQAFEMINLDNHLDLDQKSVAIIDIGATMTGLNVLKSGELIYTREQPFGGKQLTEEIMRRYGLSYQDAGRAKRAGGLPDNYEEEVLEPFKQTIAQHVNRYLQFFYSSESGTEIDHVVLAGGSAVIEGLCEVVEGHIGVPTIVANPFAQVEIASHIPHNKILQDAPAMMIACGLALRGVN